MFGKKDKAAADQTSLAAQKGKGKSNKKGGKSGFRKINDWLHLWMGLTSGIIVVIVSLTGCIYAFEKEIRSVTQPYQFVEAQNKPFLPPSQVKQIAAGYLFGNKADSMGKLIQNISYGGKEKAVTAGYNDKKEGFIAVYMNPYTGALLYKKYYEKDFFRFILEGHFNLWMPRPIGQPIVAVAILLFVLLLISGMVMWWPKNLKKANRDKSFKIKWGASFKRVNYDLHNVLGFYVMLVAFMIAATGLVWGFKWWAKGTYYITSGGKTMPVFKRPFSDTTSLTAQFIHADDILWQKGLKEYHTEEGLLMIQYPVKKSDAYGVMFNPDEETHFRRQFRYFDQYSLAELKGGGGVYAQPFERATAGDKIARMNYDIHVGAVLGLPGKILAFFASLICATLPVTGFLVWWGKKKKKKQPVAKKEAASAVRVKVIKPATKVAEVEEPVMVQATGATGDVSPSGA